MKRGQSKQPKLTHPWGFQSSYRFSQLERYVAKLKPAMSKATVSKLLKTGRKGATKSG